MKKGFIPFSSGMVFPLVAILFSAVYLRQVTDISAQDALLVKPVAFILIGLAAATLILEFRKARNRPETFVKPVFRIPLKVVFFIVSCSVYLAVLTRLGFIPSTALFIAAVSWFLGVRKMKTLIGVAVIVPLVLYLLFQVLLEVPLPAGILQFLYV